MSLPDSRFPMMEPRLRTAIEGLLVATMDLTREDWPKALAPVVDAVNDLAAAYLRPPPMLDACEWYTPLNRPKSRRRNDSS